jgi:hypothetical protein
MAGIVGNAPSRCRTCAQNGSNADGPFTCEYREGELDATALETVSLDNPSRAAIARIDKPSLPRRYLICAQSCTVIGPFDPGWVAVLKERLWPTFQGAPTPVASAAVVSPSLRRRPRRADALGDP